MRSKLGTNAFDRPRAPFSATSFRKFETSSSGSPAAASSTAAFEPASICGLPITERSCGTSAIASATAASCSWTSRDVPALERGVVERAGVHAVGDAHALDGFLLQRREVELVDRLLDEAALVGLREHLPGHLLGGLEREARHLGADLADGARGLGLDVPARLLDAPLPLGVEPPVRRRCWSSATRRASASISSAWTRAAASASRCCATSSSDAIRAWSAASSASRMRSRRLSIAVWMGPNATRLSTKNVIAKQISVQIMRPGTTSMIPEPTTLVSPSGIRRARRRAARR